MIRTRFFATMLAASSVFALNAMAQEVALPAPTPTAPAIAPLKAETPKKLPAKERVEHTAKWQEEWKTMTPQQREAVKQKREKEMQDRRMKEINSYKAATPAEREKIRLEMEARQVDSQTAIARQTEMRKAKQAEKAKAPPAAKDGKTPPPPPAAGKRE